MIYALYLILIGAAEAVVHLWRIRTGTGDDALMSALSAYAVTLLRAAWVALGISAVMDGAGYGPLLAAYPLSAGLVTWVVHGSLGGGRGR